MSKKITLLTLICAISVTLYSSDSMEQKESLKDMVTLIYSSKDRRLFENLLLINTINKRFETNNAWIEQNLKKQTDATLEKAFNTIKKSAEKMVIDLRSIHTILGATSLDHEQIMQEVKRFTNYRDVQFKEAKNKLTSLRKRRFPPVSSTKKEIIDVLLAYAEACEKVAQKAMEDFYHLDAEIYKKELIKKQS